jgi:hypothetical protein
LLFSINVGAGVQIDFLVDMNWDQDTMLAFVESIPAVYEEMLHLQVPS